MCLALPARVIALLDNEQALVDLGGVRKQISVALVTEAQVGDYVVVHVGHALAVLDEAEALATLALFAELARSSSASGASGA